MSTQTSKKSTERVDHRKRRLPDGNLVEFLVSPATQTWSSFMCLRAQSNPSFPEMAVRDG